MNPLQTHNYALYEAVAKMTARANEYLMKFGYNAEMSEIRNIGMEAQDNVCIDSWEKVRALEEENKKLKEELYELNSGR